jgi:NAD(P)-dependent dehydrogenase (short-subunit alcohol dehydrogenase family)
MNILITGGASGLGLSITKLLAKDQTNTVYFTFCNSFENAKRIEADFSNSVAVKCDFKNHEDIKSLTAKMPQFELNVLINNAYFGNVTATHFHKIPLVEFLTDFSENILPTIEITQEAINHFRKQKQGKIITILTSSLMNVPPIGSSIYVANKAYLEKMTKIWANENVKFNITSNSVSPSFMPTGLTKDFDERVIEQMTLNHPLKKLITVEEVAETVLFLVNASNQINGVDLVLNAGVNIK